MACRIEHYVYTPGDSPESRTFKSARFRTL